jgi:hypothetical protein
MAKDSSLARRSARNRAPKGQRMAAGNGQNRPKLPMNTAGRDRVWIAAAVALAA